MDLGLRGKVAIVTGSGRGIGAETVLALAQEGVKVVVTDIDAESARATQQRLAALGFDAIAVPVDVCRAESVDALVRAAVDAFGSVHILVNNAGFPRDNYLTKMPESDWDAVIDTILKGAYYCTKAVLPMMMAQRFGRIINISSRAHLGNPGQANYSAAKAGIIGFTRAVSLEQGRYNITSNAIAPGFIETEGIRSLPHYQRIAQAAIAKTPLERVGAPRDIANAVVYLASDAAGYITGETLHVTGGRYG